jgi:hypothetical protein
MKRERFPHREPLLPEMPWITRIVATLWVGAMIFVVCRGCRREVNWAPMEPLAPMARRH